MISDTSHVNRSYRLSNIRVEPKPIFTMLVQIGSLSTTLPLILFSLVGHDTKAGSRIAEPSGKYRRLNNNVLGNPAA